MIPDRNSPAGVLRRLLDAIRVEDRGLGRTTLHIESEDLRSIALSAAAQLAIVDVDVGASGEVYKCPACGSRACDCEGKHIPEGDRARWEEAHAVRVDEQHRLLAETFGRVDIEQRTTRELSGRLRHDCIGGKEHGEVLTFADDPEHFDPTVLGETPNDTPYGYCIDCKQGFRWSVSLQRWRLWPGRLARLPELPDEELEALHGALVLTVNQLRDGASASSMSIMRAVAHRLAVLNSLDTAVQEARYSLD